MAIGLGPSGPLFPLATLASGLGASLRPGPLGQGYELVIGDTTVLLGAQSPAITLGRSLSDSFAGIRPGDAPEFIAAQIIGGLVGLLLARVLFPDQGAGRLVSNMGSSNRPRV